jgi:hypothetical protein
MCVQPESPTLLQLSPHAVSLGVCLEQFGSIDNALDFFCATGDLLKLAGCVERVSIDIDHFVGEPTSPGAYEERSRLASDYAGDLSRFIFTYTAYEVFLGRLPGQLKVAGTRQGLAQRTSAYLGRHYTTSPVAHYACILESAYRDVRTWDRLEAERRSRWLDQPGTVAGRGFQIAAKLRNLMMHDGVEFPETWDAKATEQRLLRTATRLTLLTFQMVVIAWLRHNSEYDLVLWERPVSETLSLLHLERLKALTWI